MIVMCGSLETAVMPGSKIYKCTKCGHDCVCSTIGQEQINKGGEPCCFDCSTALIEEQVNKGLTPKFIGPTEAIKAAAKFIRSRETN